MARDTVGRFNERVANYIAYRPKYPAAVAEFLRNELGLSAASVVAALKREPRASPPMLTTLTALTKF